MLFYIRVAFDFVYFRKIKKLQALRLFLKSLLKSERKCDIITFLQVRFSRLLRLVSGWRVCARPLSTESFFYPQKNPAKLKAPDRVKTTNPPFLRTIVIRHFIKNPFLSQDNQIPCQVFGTVFIISNPKGINSW